MIGQRTLRAALVLGSVIGTCFGIEVGLRFFYDAEGQKYSLGRTQNQYRFYQYDPKLGWSNSSKHFGVMERDEFVISVRINEWGMRSAPVDRDRKPAGKKRIAFLGDSFVWGIGVPDEKRFTDIVGRSAGVEALNFGVSGYSPVQYWLQLPDIIRFKPDLVVISFCPSNDFGDNVMSPRYGYYKPYAELDERGEVQIRGYPIPNVKQYGAEAGKMPGERKPVASRFKIVQLISKATSRFGASRPAHDPGFGTFGLTQFEDRDLYRYDALSKEQRAVVDRAVLVNQRLFHEIKRALDKEAIPFVVVAGPTNFEYAGGTIQNGAIRKLKASLASEKIKVIDIVREMSPKDFWPHDGHWNERGHQKVAAAIVSYLSGR